MTRDDKSAVYGTKVPLLPWWERSQRNKLPDETAGPGGHVWSTEHPGCVVPERGAARSQWNNIPHELKKAKQGAESKEQTFLQAQNPGARGCGIGR